MKGKRGFWRGSTGVAGLALAVFALLALLGPWISPEDPNKIDVMRRFASPGPGQFLGRDELGRDVLSRLLAGAAVSMGVGLVAALLTTLMGVLIGAVAGYQGGWLDAGLMRAADVIMCVPFMPLVLTLMVVLGPGLQNVIIVIVVTEWTGTARIVRAEVMSLRERDFILAARASGARSWPVIWRHLLPNAMGPVYVALTFGVAEMILAESSLSFLGLGVQAPRASWGSLLSSGRQSIDQAWWLTVFPGLLIFAVMMLVNHLGESARRHFDPKRAG